MAEMVGSCVVQEMVSRAISHVVSKPEEDKASMAVGHMMERLEMAHSGLELALERSGKLPITDVSLLRQRRMFKRAHDECGHVLYKHKLRILEDEEAKKKGIRPSSSSSSSSSSFTGKVTHAVKSYFFGPAMDGFSCSGTSLGRFEWFADKAAKFVRDVESGCSLSHYRFFDPLITQLLQGIVLEHETVQGSQRCQIFIEPVRSQEHGVVASLWFRSEDSETPTRGFNMALMLRLSESTDIVGIASGCLGLLGPKLRSSAQFVTGKLAQLPARDVSRHRVVAAGAPMNLSVSVRLYRPDPLCCRENSRHAATRPAASELSHGFLEQVILMSFQCYVPASAAPDHYGCGDGGVVTDWPPLRLSVFFTPHCFHEDDDMGSSHVLRTVGGREEGTCYSLHQTWEMARAKAVDFFVCRPEVAEYEMLWESLHGFASLVFERHGVPRSPGPGVVAKARY